MKQNEMEMNEKRKDQNLNNRQQRHTKREIANKAPNATQTPLRTTGDQSTSCRMYGKLKLK
jgi:hypothetical protein